LSWGTSPILLVDPSFLQSVNVSILPRDSGNYNLGSNDKRWKEIFGLYIDLRPSFDSGVVDAIYMANTDPTAYSVSPAITFEHADTNLDFGSRIYHKSDSLRIDIVNKSTGEYENVVSISRASILPLRTLDLGSPDNEWNNIYGKYLSITRNFTSGVETGLILENKADDFFSPKIVFKNNESITEGKYQVAIYGYMNALRIISTEDNWSSQKTVATFGYNEILFNNTVRPISDGNIDLGTSDYRWNNIYSCKNIITRSFDTNPQYAYQAEDGLVLKNKSTNTTLSPKILFENSGVSDEKVAIVAGRAGHGYVLSVCSTPDNWSTVKAPLEIGIDGIDIVTSTHLYPAGDGEYDLGASNRRWKNLYAINIYAGDINLNNGWKVTELPDGLVVKDPSGQEIFKITKDGIWFKGKKIGE